MLMEISVERAFNAWQKGMKGFAIDPPSQRAFTFEDMFSDIAGWTYLVDIETEETALVEQEHPESTKCIASEEMGGSDTAPHRKKRTKREMQEAVLKAWNGGERSITEVMAIVGCTYQAARRYLPISEDG